MMHLILPPVLIIGGISLLLWYLSRRAADPEIVAKMDVLENGTKGVAKARSLSRQEFWLKFVERAISMFKVVSLRVHNFFQHSTEEIRKQRKKIQEMKRVVDNVSVSAEARSTPVSRPSFAQWWQQHQPEPSDTKPDNTQEERVVSEVPVIAPVIKKLEQMPVQESIEAHSFLKRLRKVDPAQSQPIVVAEAPREVKALLGKKTTPTVAKKRVRDEKWKEDQYIERIAQNPRDLEAYEALGDYYFDRENILDAKACYRQVLKIQPTNRLVKIKIRKIEKHFEKTAR